MRLPRDISGDELVARLSRYGYKQTHQTGSHVQLLAVIGGRECRLTVPRHGAVRVGTLAQILRIAAGQLGRSRDDLAEELFGR